nr:hypothetical protein [Nocardioides zeae]
MSSIDSAKVATFSASTTGTLATSRSSPPSAGPTKTARLSRVPLAAFAAASSRGSSASAGIQARCAERNGAAKTPASVAST